MAAKASSAAEPPSASRFERIRPPLQRRDPASSALHGFSHRHCDNGLRRDGGIARVVRLNAHVESSTSSISILALRIGGALTTRGGYSCEPQARLLRAS